MVKPVPKTLLSLASIILVTPAMADWPIAVADEFVMHQSYSVSRLDLLKNDIGSNLKIVSVNEWSENGARVSLSERAVTNRSYAYGNISYNPAADFVGSDGFWYVIEDDQGRKNAARVAVEVKPASLPLPTSLQDFIDIPKDTPTRINPLANDLFTNMTPRIAETFRGKIVDYNFSSANGGKIEKVEVYPEDYLQIGGLQNGQFLVENTFKYQLKYTPPAGFVGTDSFTYAVQDSRDGNDELVNDPVSWTKVTLNVADNSSKGPWPAASPDEAVALITPFSFENTLDVLKNDIGEGLIIKLPSAYSEKGARLKILPNHPNRPTILYSGGPVGQVDRVWYVIEDAYGRQNYSYIDVTVEFQS